MSTQKYEFQTYNSPCTDMFDMNCRREAAEAMSMQATDAEQPTHDALADVYNRDNKTATQSRRF